MIALIDADDQHHAVLLEAFEQDPGAWVVPWAVLPEVDYLVLTHLGIDVELAFVTDINEGTWRVEWGEAIDVERARELCVQYRSLKLGLVDAVVMAMAERLGAGAIATLDLRHFGAVPIAGKPRLLPRDSLP